MPNLPILTRSYLLSLLILILQTMNINALHIKIRGTGGVRSKTPGPGAQQALRALARADIKIGRIGESGCADTPMPLLYLCSAYSFCAKAVRRNILHALLVLMFFSHYLLSLVCAEDATPLPTDSTRVKGSRRGRRL